MTKSRSFAKKKLYKNVAQIYAWRRKLDFLTKFLDLLSLPHFFLSSKMQIFATKEINPMKGPLT